MYEDEQDKWVPYLHRKTRNILGQGELTAGNPWYYSKWYWVQKYEGCVRARMCVFVQVNSNQIPHSNLRYHKHKRMFKCWLSSITQNDIRQLYTAKREWWTIMSFMYLLKYGNTMNFSKFWSFCVRTGCNADLTLTLVPSLQAWKRQPE